MSRVVAIKSGDAVLFPSAGDALRTLDRLDAEIEQAPSFARIDFIANSADAIRRAFKGVYEVTTRAGKTHIKAELRLAAELDAVDLSKGGGTGANQYRAAGSDLVPAAEVTLEGLGITKKRSARCAKLLELKMTDQIRGIIDTLEEKDKPIHPNTVLAEARRLNKVEKVHRIATAAFSETGPFDVVVIDPPWKMEKIDREVRPNQDAFDYPVMTTNEIEEFWTEKIEGQLQPDVHLFMWTTQKHLPFAITLLPRIGFHYVLTMVWHKPGGFQPIGLPQYNCEFVLYARKGAPEFIDTKAFNCCFDAPRREHSRKPDEFYDTIRRVTGGSRIDVFSREKRDGFAQYGNQADHFEVE
jgi:N6-adenosine-specific RNA methylase IME4